MQSQEPGEAFGAQFPLQQSKGMPLKLPVPQSVEGDHSAWLSMRPTVQLKVQGRHKNGHSAKTEASALP